jgi:Na+-transporting NADH:ubiquinone oxidoreductase subunit D
MAQTPAPTPIGGPTAKSTLIDGLWHNNPIFCQILGICSALAVTTRLENSLVMGVALIFVIAMSNLAVSVLRHLIPRRIRMIVEVLIIATFVIVFDQILKGYYWQMSKQLGPYVGLIITNCIVMGRAEAYALHNKTSLSFLDGISNGLGYAIILAIIGAVREIIGTGALQLAGHQLYSLDWYSPNHLFIYPPGAFIVLGILIWIVRAIKPAEESSDSGAKP